MDTSSEISAFDRGIGPLLNVVLPGRTQTVLEYQPDPELQRRIEELAEKSTEGNLSEEERAEYAGYIRANKFVAIFRRQAEKLNASSTP